MRRFLLLIITLGLALAGWARDVAAKPSAAVPAAGVAALIEIEGAIGPATSQYLEQAMGRAQVIDAQLIILRLDTPGGLDTAMRDMIKRILHSEIPVVAYVGPAGARAASAGTYLVYASHIAAMAPATNLGAATPISIMPSGPKPSPGKAPEKTSPDKTVSDKTAKKNPEEKSGTEALPSELAAERKAVNDAVAYLRALAEKRGRNVEWTERAVREGASLSAEQALKLGVINLISADLPSLLRDLEGRKVAVSHGVITLQTKNLSVHTLEPGWRLRLLAVLTNPTVAYILMLIGLYGLLLEGYSPGSILPGVLGGICLLLALYAFQILPINYVGLALIALGIILIVAETFVPSLGILGIGGVIAFVIGSIMLMDRDIPGHSISLALIAALATAASAALLFMVILLMRSRRHVLVTGIEALLREPAEALEDFQGEGWVLVHSESWRARCEQAVYRGQRLRVTRIDGLMLIVEAEASFTSPESHHAD